MSDESKNKSKPFRIRIPVTITLNEDVLQKVDYYSKKLGLNRSKFIENLILASLDDVKLFNDVKLLDFYLYLKNFFDKFQIDDEILKKIKNKGVSNEEPAS